MRDARRVRRAQGASEIHGEPYELLGGELAALEAPIEWLALDQLHRQTEAPRQLDEVVDAHDVGMRDLAGHLQLAPEALQAHLRALAVLQELEGDDRVGLQIAGAVDDALAAAPELAEDLVAVAQDLAAFLREPGLRD